MHSDTKRLSDISLVAYLSTIGHKIIELQPGRKYFFVFEVSSKLEEDILKYFNKAATVDPHTYSNTLRDLKGLILQNKSRQDGNSSDA